MTPPPYVPSHPDFQERDSGPDLMVGSVLALRSFLLTEGVLFGVSYDQPALDGVNVATCPFGWHEAPTEGCSCGFYAYDRTEFGRRGRPFAEGALSAVVELSGKIIVCERGLKAEHMKVVAVAPTAAWDDDLKKTFQGNYPSVLVFEGEESMLRSFPITTLSRGDSEGDQSDQNNHMTAKGVLRDARDFLTSEPSIRLLVRLLLAICFLTLSMNLMSSVLPVTGPAYFGLLIATTTYARTVTSLWRAVVVGAIVVLFSPFFHQIIEWSMTHTGDFGFLGKIDLSNQHSPFASVPKEVIASWMSGFLWIAMGAEAGRAWGRARAARKMPLGQPAAPATLAALALAPRATPSVSTCMPARVMTPGKVPPGVRVVTARHDDAESTSDNHHATNEGDTNG